ncbi:hypothetical protein ACKJUK_001247 [Cronobacter turicensis]
MLFKKIEAGEFEVDVIIIIQVIDTDNLVTGCQQTFANMKTNKACCAGNQKFHTILINYAMLMDAPRPIA